jgi:hypothetical protein
MAMVTYLSIVCKSKSCQSALLEAYTTMLTARTSVLH